MRRPLVAGNWKMNGSLANNGQLLEGVVAGCEPIGGVEVAVCPPFVYLSQARDVLSGSAVVLGAQNVNSEALGAHTGEIAAEMLVDLGCRYVIVGHSERRQNYGERPDWVARKFERAQSVGLVPILCVGETLAERQDDLTEAVVGSQLDAVLDRVGVDSFGNAVIAYEPVWAIGTGKTASPEQANDVHRFIRECIAERNDSVGDGLRILYGGSVKPGNAGDLFACPDIDGGLIGGASLKAEDFLGICRAACPPAS